MVSTGIDSGSTVTKIAVIRDGAVIHADSAPTGTDPVRSGTILLERARSASPADSGREPGVCVTGYGRKLLARLGVQKTEISCHALGAHALVTGKLTTDDPRLTTPDPRLQPHASSLAPGFVLLDIGGQDSKAIRVDAGGHATDFAMNDKCAAGTGKFLEVISRTLGFGMEGVSAAAIASSRKARLSSMCTVFADSEVVSLTARGERPDEIAWAACYAVAERCAGLVKRMGLTGSPSSGIPPPAVPRPSSLVPPPPSGVLVFTGGVSDIPAVAEALKEILRVEVVSPPLARFSGAIGAALFAEGSR
jgi:predicted CoA-substrate-specific enzyme activase